MWCYSATNNNSSYVYNSALTGVLIDSAFDKKSTHSRLQSSDVINGPKALKK